MEFSGTVFGEKDGRVGGWAGGRGDGGRVDRRVGRRVRWRESSEAVSSVSVCLVAG